MLQGTPIRRTQTLMTAQDAPAHPGIGGPSGCSHVGLINAAWRLAHPEPVTPAGSLGR